MQILDLPVENIRPNPQQPRTVFDDDYLVELSQSIKAQGQKTPVQVTPADADGIYTLIAGECRLRAIKLHGGTTIKAIIETDAKQPQDMLVEAMTENIQRRNMNVVDEANGYRRLRDEHHLNVRQISKKLGVYEKRITDMLKLADLEEEIKNFIREKKLPGSPDAVNALLSVPEASRVKFATSLSERGVTIKIIQSAAEKYNAALKQKQEQPKNEPPALSVARTRRKAEPELTKWNALAQAGKVPPYELFVAHVTSTCDACALRPLASPSTCSECPLAQMTRSITEAAHV
jgi:ParB family chromosome partitioning protein